ncbi:MAG: hypothetical protein R2733_18995 [Acidimicrobiales bacterium]
MDSTADVTAHAELDRLLAAPPVGALELHVADRHRRVPIGERLAEFAVDEVLFTVLGGEPGGGDETPRMATVGWAGARGALAGVAMAPSDMDAAAHRAVMIAARQRAIPVRYFVEDAQLVGSSVREIGVVGGPRPHANPGRLASEARLLDIPSRFEVEIHRIDRPSLVGRKVMRRGPFEEVFRVVMDDHWIVIDYRQRTDPVRIEIPRSEFLGIANARRSPLALTPSDAWRLPSLEDWSRTDYRGREFASWAYERVLSRSGL